MISIICPSRSRPEKSIATQKLFLNGLSRRWHYEFIVSIDDNDPSLPEYTANHLENWLNKGNHRLLISKNRSCVDAINNAAKVANGNIFVVMSDDTSCGLDWDMGLWNDVNGKEDFLLKTDDGIQDYIVTQTIMDRKYYERDGFIYHPEFKHQFADTYLTCLADIRGRLIKSDLLFPHKHYSHSGGKEMPDALHRRNDDTWMTGQDTFIKLMKQFTPEERARIKDPSMRGFLRKFGL